MLFQIYCTGHSLGGALATLAAYDISRAMEWGIRPTKVICYTFGAPRLGNYAFAETYNRLVPETWNVVNDQVRVDLSHNLLLASSCAHYLQQWWTVRSALSYMSGNWPDTTHNSIRQDGGLWQLEWGTLWCRMR